MIGCRVLLGERIQGARVQISDGGNVCVELGNGLLDGGGLQGEVYTAGVAAEERAPRHRMQTWTCPGRGHWLAGRAAVRSGAGRALSVAGPGRGVSGMSTVAALTHPQCGESVPAHREQYKSP